MLAAISPITALGGVLMDAAVQASPTRADAAPLFLPELPWIDKRKSVRL